MGGIVQQLFNMAYTLLAISTSTSKPNFEGNEPRYVTIKVLQKMNK